MCNYCFVKCLIIGDCNYWNQVPKSLNITICNVTEGTTVQLLCAMHHPCNSTSFDVKWYKSTNETYADAECEVIEDNSENINKYNFSDCKYNVSLVSEPQSGTATESNSDNCCFTSYVLSISHFNSRDNGHYWCQFVANDSHPLSYPYGYITLSEETTVNTSECRADDFIIDNKYLDTAQCAENITLCTMKCGSQNSTTFTDITITPTSDITPYTSTTVTQIATKSKESTNYGSETVYYTSASTTTTSHGTTPKENNLLMYGAIAGAFVCFFIVLFLVVMCCATLFCKYRKLKKKSKYRCVRDASMGITLSHSYPRQSNVQQPLTSQTAESDSTMVINDGHNEDFVNHRKESFYHEPTQHGVVNKDGVKESIICKSLVSKQPLSPPTASESDDKAMVVSESRNKTSLLHQPPQHHVVDKDRKPAPVKCKQPIFPPSRKDTAMVVSDNADFVYCIKDSTSFLCEPPQHPVVMYLKDKKIAPVKCKPPVLPPGQKDTAIVVSDEHNLPPSRKDTASSKHIHLYV